MVSTPELGGTFRQIVCPNRLTAHRLCEWHEHQTSTTPSPACRRSDRHGTLATSSTSNRASPRTTSIRSSASLPTSRRVTDREVMVKAGEILAQHGALTADFIIEQMSQVLDDRIAVEDWRRVAAAIDEITDAKPQ